jgi:hypothetical protein
VTARGHAGEEASQALGNRGPVTGTAPRHEHSGGLHHDATGRADGRALRREAVLRVLLEAYRRDVGPGALDPS